MLKKLFNDESGVIISAELCLVLTICVLSLVVGLNEVAKAVTTELNDISNAIGALDQSYYFSGFHSTSGQKKIAFSYGSFFQDGVDDCDVNTTCDIVCGNIVGEGGTHQGIVAAAP